MKTKELNTKKKQRKSSTNILMQALLRLMAANFNYRSSLKQLLKSKDGWLSFVAGFQTENKSVNSAIKFHNGKVSVLGSVPENCDFTLIFYSDKEVKKLLGASPTEQLFMIMKSEFRTVGNANTMSLFFFLMSKLLIKTQLKMMNKEKETSKITAKDIASVGKGVDEKMLKKMTERLKAPEVDSGVKYIEDPYLSKYSINDFPRVKNFLDIHFETKPEVCAERPKLATEWSRANGFEKDMDGKLWIPELRQGYMLKHILENRKPIIRKNDLIAGTTTSKEIGVVIYPDSHCLMIWQELLTVPHRPLNPYNISQETLDTLHHDVFPYWIDKNFKEWVRKEYGNPLSQKIDERFAVYFIWKQAALSHTIPDFPKIMGKGTKNIIEEIRERLKDSDLNLQQKGTLEGMILTLEGLTSYSKNLSIQAAEDAKKETDSERKKELEDLAAICSQVVERPARTLHEAVNAMWITWVGLHMENTNAGLSLGRLDQWLQPYFIDDITKLKTKKEREDYIEFAIELLSSFYMRATDHLPLTPDFANWYFGGSSSDQAITLGGVKPNGDDAVNDMTYILLKVTEMLTIRDPNVNARFSAEKNSDTYLKRLCEVNLITAGTPSIHNDKSVFTSLDKFNYDIEDIRDWSATGCVEPTLSGKHIGHTNFQMINMVSAIEMAMHNGYHPTMKWKVGPDTGNIEDDDFKTFDSFFDAYAKQFGFLIDQSVEYNEMLGKAHQKIRPTPLLSSMIDGTIDSAKDVTHGGAKYNSSGAACIGLADVTDSLMTIKKLVFDEKKVSFKELKEAVVSDFENNPGLLAMINNKVPSFGSGSDEAVEMANRVTKFTQDYYNKQSHYRGGKYTAGFWSMSLHVIYGNLSGALPSGKRSGKALTPGLTPKGGSSDNLLDNLLDVAKLDPRNMSNNIAFNVKIAPNPEDSWQKNVDIMKSYVKSYFNGGGMQMQMNVVTADTLRDAMVHPENYRNLLVRISGYNAYFVTLNREMQIELIERSSFNL